jgi:hypothetical protein
VYEASSYSDSQNIRSQRIKETMNQRGHALGTLESIIKREQASERESERERESLGTLESIIKILRRASLTDTPESSAILAATRSAMPAPILYILYILYIYYTYTYACVCVCVCVFVCMCVCVYTCFAGAVKEDCVLREEGVCELLRRDEPRECHRSGALASAYVSIRQHTSDAMSPAGTPQAVPYLKRLYLQYDSRPHSSMSQGLIAVCLKAS